MRNLHQLPDHRTWALTPIDRGGNHRTMAYDSMRAAAARLGWKLDPTDPGLRSIYSSVTLTGAESGFPVRLERIGGTHQFSTHVFLDPPLLVQFAITHEGLRGALANILGFHDVEVGDPAFDKAFRIVSKDPDAVRRLLGPEVKAALWKVSTSTSPLGFRGFHVSEAGVSINRIYVYEVTPEQLMLDVPIAIELARALKTPPATQ